MKSLPNRILFSFGIGVFGTAMLLAAMLHHSPQSVANAAGSITDCAVRGIIVSGPSPNPSIFSEQESVVTQLSAEYDQPKVSDECNISGPVWSWTIKKVERSAPGSSTWSAHSYRPAIQHPNSNSPAATLTAVFPQPGSWRVTMEVTASWGSTNCIGCSPIGTVVVEATVSSCSFTGVMTPTDDFMGRSYSRIGLAETGSLSVRVAAGTNIDDLKPLKWRIASGGEFLTIEDSGSGNGTAIFEAKKSSGRAVLEVTTSKTTCRAAMTIDVVAPSQVYHEYTQDDPRSGIANNLVGYGVIDNVYLKPVDVSFHLISFGEGTSLADGTGVYLPKKNLLHQASGPIAMLMGNSVKGTQLNGTDTVFNGGVPRNGGVGQFIWVIPQQYFSDDGNRINIQNGDLSHIATFDGNQTIRIQKGGVDRSGPP